MARGSYSNKIEATNAAIDTGWIDMAGSRSQASILIFLQFDSSGTEDFVVQIANQSDGTEPYESETFSIVGGGTEWGAYLNTARYIRITAASATTVHSITFAGA